MTRTCRLMVFTMAFAIAAMAAVLPFAGCSNPSAPSDASGGGVGGTWTGIWQSTGRYYGASGTLTLALSQSGDRLTGSLDSGSACVTSGSLTGSVSGSGMSLQTGSTANTAGYTVLTGLVDPTSRSLSGPYRTTGGGCTGDVGTWTVNKR